MTNNFISILLNVHSYIKFYFCHFKIILFLIFSKNELTDIPEDIFSGMPSIHTVSLKENKITTIEERTWYSIWEQLGTVSLDGKNIS